MKGFGFKMGKNKVVISIVFGIIAMFLVVIMSIQFKTINQTDITSLESMQEEELRNQIVELKEKNDEIQNKISENEEKIKEYKENIDVLTLSATPIPRTLQMSLTGVRGLSLIETPPAYRYPIQTYVLKENDQVIRDAIY